MEKFGKWGKGMKLYMRSEMKEWIMGNGNGGMKL